MVLWKILNVFFFAFHTCIIVVNTFGWLWKKTRPLSRIVLLLTCLSWFGLGVFFGWGYCFCTDWHWQVRAHLGIHDDPNSYLVLMIRELTGLTPPDRLVFPAALIVLITSVMGCTVLSIKDWHQQKTNEKNSPTRKKTIDH